MPTLNPIIKQQDLFATNHIDEIIEYVCNEYDIKSDSLFSSSRKATYTQARALVYYGLYIGLGWSYHEIGTVYDKHHSTIIASMKQLDALIKKAPNGIIARRCNNLIGLIRGFEREPTHKLIKFIFKHHKVDLLKTIPKLNDTLIQLDNILRTCNYRISIHRLKPGEK